MPSQKYWQNRKRARFAINEAYMHRESAKAQMIYNRVLAEINRDIATIWRNYSKKSGVDIQSLQKFISSGERERLFSLMQGVETPEYIERAYTGRITRLEAMKLELHAKVKAIYGDQVKLMTETNGRIINESYYRAAFDLEKGSHIRMPFVGINERRLNAMLRTKWAGGNYSTRVWRNTSALAREISTMIPVGLTSGKSGARMSREVRQRFGVAKYQADRLIRTETTYFENQAEAALYEDLGVDEYQYMAVLDSRTTHVCQELNGKIFNLKDKQVGVNFPPMLPNCRSTTVAYLGDEFAPTVTRTQRTRAGEYSLAGKDSETYNKWLKDNGYNYSLPIIPKPNVAPR